MTFFCLSFSHTKTEQETEFYLFYLGDFSISSVARGNPEVSIISVFAPQRPASSVIVSSFSDLADYIAEQSEAAVKERGAFAIALSCGSLIGLTGLDWSKWHIFWADERVVAENRCDSNYKLAKDFSKVPIVPSHVHSINDSVSAEEAADEYITVSVPDISDCPKFDLILLGIGPDGHVASLFPNHSALNETDKWVTFIVDSPKPPPERITFTFPVINSASNVAVVVTSNSKAEAVHLAIDNIEPNCPSLPAQLVQPTIGKLIWFSDKPAASKLVSE
ncbi:hypothetical protein J1N35_042469 [Gossypium stocksii]|uniref:Probable 6-phosphogluconolactonase n=1 Tax=Gossypium stocksii TaxID=47602 RepID=A0A9D3UHL6_9ROSI|nr:hypothetical protein J1N35_042469 [Gossypium stocksii]